MANYTALPNTGLNASLPIYLLVGLVLLLVGLASMAYTKIKG